MRQIAVLVVVLAIFAWVFVVILQPGERDPAKAKAWQKLSPSQRRTLARAGLPEAARRTAGKRELDAEEGFPAVDMGAEGEPVTWKELVSDGWRPGMDVPTSVRDLHGRYVGIRGYMLPFEEQEAVSEFLLVPSYASCYFKRNLTLTDFIRARSASGPVRFVDIPLYVVGRLSVGLERIDGEPASLYRLEVIRVEQEDIFERKKHEKEDEQGREPSPQPSPEHNHEHDHED
jgi:hypothetical protein